MDAIRQPWIMREDAIGSVTAFANLQTIAAGLAHKSPYDNALVDTLRGHLGDWRDQIRIPDGVGEDLLLRSEFYVEQGFDPNLTEFPNPVFEETLENGGLRQRIPESKNEKGTAIPAPDGVEVVGLVRTSEAHDRLMRLELHMRVFLEERMRQVVGENWIRQRVHPNTRQSWLDKQETAVQSGEEKKALIHYADFADYAMLIERCDNWNEVFKPIFGRKEDIRESWQRLFPIRIATMHARIISQDDELLLAVESKRILKAIGIMK